MATAVPNLPFSVPGGGDAALMWKVIVPLVLVKDAQGLIHYKYHGSMVPWLSPEQEALFLEHGFIEKVVLNPAAEPTPPTKDQASETDPVDLDTPASDNTPENDDFLTDPTPDAPAPKTRQRSR